MSLTFIETNKLPRTRSTGQGEVAEVLNEALCGARNVQGLLRWLNPSEEFKPAPTNRHQLIYLMEGKGSIGLNGRDYAVEKGAGVYLGPSETATVKAAGGASLKLFHLIVPQIPK
jgi:hypothetical protein